MTIIDDHITFIRDTSLGDKSEYKESVGGKGANLLELAAQGFPVPDGFIVTTGAYQEFLQRQNLGEKLNECVSIDPDDTEAVEEATTAVEEILTTTNCPSSIRRSIADAYSQLDSECPVAVRSSATAEDLPDASFAGQLETYLNIQGVDSVIAHVQKCWASLFTERAILYRAEQGYDVTDLGIAVVVQQMIDADKSGVLFSAHPVTGEDETIIEASWGLGESVVGGDVSPDMYKLSETGDVEKEIKTKEVMYCRDPATGETVKQRVPVDKQNQQVLTDDEIRRLKELCQEVADSYGSPQDIEWAIADGDIFVLQTRPITTISEEPDEPSSTNTGSALAEGLGASSGTASGHVCLSPIEAVKRSKKGEDVILVRKMTSPSDMHGIKVSNGILTSQGGTTCHAAIVSRELDKPAVVGCDDLEIDSDEGVVRIGETVLQEDDRITIDGKDGKVLTE